MTNDWLQNLKVGDRVIIRGRMGEGRSIGQVGRLTKTRVMVNVGRPSETAFRIADGREVGGDTYSAYSLEQGTPEALESVAKESRRKKLARELNHRNWDNVPLEILEVINSLFAKPAGA